MPATKRGIYHNLKESKYTVSNSEIVFFFSSMFYLEKFMVEYKPHREIFLERIERISTDNPLNLTTLADIECYKTIEKRGFRCTLNGMDITWEDLHQYALRKMNHETTLDWIQIEAPCIKQRVKAMERGRDHGSKTS